MATSISLFPTLDEKLKGKIRYQVTQYELFYVRDDTEYVLRAEEIDNSIIMHKLIDDEGVWTPDNYSIHIRRKYSLSTYQCLFGERGIACKNAVLGLGLVWTSSDSKQRGVIPIGELINSNNDILEELEYKFPKGQLRGSIELTTVIYLKSAGTPRWGEEHLANEYGCILGELDKFIIQLDGTGSVFPISEMNEVGQPLWYVKCDWDDPTYDQFIECVCVHINTAHKNYKFLDKTKKTFDEQLMKEIMASALVIIISKLKSQVGYWENTISGEQLQQGSVSEAINYFINTLEWDVSTPEAMSLSIRKFFDQRM